MMVSTNNSVTLSDNSFKSYTSEVPIKKETEQNSAIAQQNSESVSEDILSITRENQKAINFSLSGLMDAIKKLNEMKSSLSLNPGVALSMQGNISYDSIQRLL